MEQAIKNLCDKIIVEYNKIPSHFIFYRDCLIIAIPEKDVNLYKQLYYDGCTATNTKLNYPTFLGIRVVKNIVDKIEIYYNGVLIQ